MKDPNAPIYPDQKGTRYIEKASIRTAEIVLSDLVDLGLIDERAGPVPPLYEWSTHASKNLPGYAHVTAKGSLVLDHIEPADPH